MYSATRGFFEKIAVGIAVFCIAAVPVGARDLLTTHMPAIVQQHAVPIVGAPDPATHLQLDISLPLRDSAGLAATLNAIYDPESPSWHRYLTVAEFTDRFAAS